MISYVQNTRNTEYAQVANILEPYQVTQCLTTWDFGAVREYQYATLIEQSEQSYRRSWMSAGVNAPEIDDELIHLCFCWVLMEEYTSRLLSLQF